MVQSGVHMRYIHSMGMIACQRDVHLMRRQLTTKMLHIFYSFFLHLLSVTFLSTAENLNPFTIFIKSRYICTKTPIMNANYNIKCLNDLFTFGEGSVFVLFFFFRPAGLFLHCLPLSRVEPIGMRSYVKLHVIC